MTTELTRALQLAFVGQQAQALNILNELGQAAPNDYRVWWAIANISDARDDIRQALLRVLRLKPDMNEAQEKLEDLDGPSRSRLFQRPSHSQPRGINLS